MKNITRHTGKLEVLERLKNSVNGNPRYRCYVDGFSFITRSDCGYSYTITNYRDKDVIVTIGTHYGKATLNTIELVK